MKNSSQFPLILLIVSLAVIASSLGTVWLMNSEKPMATSNEVAVLPNTDFKPPTKPVTTITDSTVPGAPSANAGQAAEVEVIAYPGSSAQGKETLDDYRFLLEKTISDFWMKAYTSPRPGNSSILDLDLARWISKMPQVSIPASLATWPSISVTPWGYGNFTAEFSKTDGSSWMDYKNSIKIRYLDGTLVGMDKKSDAPWSLISCPVGTADDIAVVANAFATLYPVAAEDKDICAHISATAIKNDAAYPGTKAYTLNTAFKPLSIDGFTGGEMGVYRPTIIAKPAKKEDMINAFKAGDFSMIEIDLRSTGSDKIAALAPTADSTIALYGDLELNGFCGYDRCY